MKKFIIILLSLALFVFCVGCGTYTPPVDSGIDIDGSGGGGGGGGGDGNIDDVTPPDWADDEMVFTVTLNIKNSYGELVRYSPRPTDNIYAQWTGEGGNGNFSAKFNSTGVASCTGLDGEYRVTLSNLPSDRTYNPNGIYVDNDFRNVNIELLDVISVQGTGKGMYVQQGTCIPINSVGTYRAHIEKAYVAGRYAAGRPVDDIKDGSVMFFQYTPTEPGYYALESIADVEDGKINPIVDVFFGNSQAKYFDETIDGGGTEGDFTKNFKWDIVVQEGYAGNSYTFGVKCDIMQGVEWPVDVYFTLTYVGAAPEAELIQPSGPYIDEVYPDAAIRSTDTWQWDFLDNSAGGGRYSTLSEKRYELYWNDLDGNGIWTPAEWKDTNGNGTFEQGDEWLDRNGNGIFDDGDQYRDTNKNGQFDILDEWWDYDGDGICGLDTGDGFYHEFDLEKYPDGYTDPITGATYPAGYGPLLWTIINGWDAIQHAQETSVSGPVNVDNILGGRVANVNGKNYYYFMAAYSEHSSRYTVRSLSSAITTTVHPVTKALMEALQDIAPGLDYFRDGDGYAETGPGVVYDVETGQYAPNGYDSGYRVDSDEDHMWRIFCGYFK